MVADMVAFVASQFTTSTWDVGAQELCSVVLIKGFIKGFEERHDYHDKPPSAPAEEGNIGMMRLLGVGPIDIISTTIMTTTLNGSLPASSDSIAPSQQPALCRCWPPAAPAAAARRGEI